MRRLRVAVCLALLALPLQAMRPATAHADPTDFGSVACTANGFFTTGPGPLPQTVYFTALLDLSCTGVGDDAALWHLNVTGQLSPGVCAGGQGLANVGGWGPDGSVNGSVTITISAASLQMEGAVSSSDTGGDGLQATLSVTPGNGIPCVSPQTTGNLEGPASITDLQPPADGASCAVPAGEENYQPGITAALASVNVAGDATLDCVNPASDENGNWDLAWQGVLDRANCGVSTGNLDVNASTPEGGASGTAGYERVGTMLLISGSLTTAHEHSFYLWGNVRPTVGNCATSPWSWSNVTGAAAVVDVVASAG